MRKLLFIIMLSLTTLLSAATLTSKTEYMAEETISIQANNLELHQQNWIGIYALNDNNDWKNVLRWTWTEETTTGSFSFKGLPQGKYEARVFYNNSFDTEATTSFSVIDKFNAAVDIETRKDTYEEHEYIEVKVENMSGHAQDWVAIYPKGSSNAWENVIDWRYTNGHVGTILGFNGLKAGEYEVRAFFRNSYHLEASHSFSVINHQTSVTPSQKTYDGSENIQINLTGFKKNQKDWIGIYPKGSSNAWENVVSWKWVDDANHNTLTFPSLPIGQYEVRGFFKNSFHVEAEESFQVVNTKIASYAKGICIDGNSRSNQNIGVICNHNGNNKLTNIFVLDKLNHKFYTMGGFDIANFTPTFSEHPLGKDRAVSQYTKFLGGDVKDYVSRYDHESNTVIVYDGSNKFCDFYSFSDLYKPNAKLNKVLAIDIPKHHLLNSIFIAQTSNDTWTIKINYTTGIDGYTDIYESSNWSFPYKFKRKENL